MTEQEVEILLFDLMGEEHPPKIRLDAVKFFLINKGVQTGYCKAINTQVAETPIELPDLSKLSLEELNTLLILNTKVEKK